MKNFYIFSFMSIFLLMGCTNVEMNPYADGSRPQQAPTYSSLGNLSTLNQIDKRIDSANPSYIPVGINNRSYTTEIISN